MSAEDQARLNHRMGQNCAAAVYAAFADALGVSPAEAARLAPKPRSEGGRCGAFLAGKKILEQIRPEAVGEYERKFIELNGQSECALLVMAHAKLRKKCNDYVGDAARLVGEALK